MARPASRHPTEFELRILKILWQEGPLRVRDIRKALADGVAGSRRKLAHTTIITILNTMVEKKYLNRTSQRNAYIYHPRITAQATGRKMLNDLVDRVFDGSATALMLSLLETAEIDDIELTRLREMINRFAKEKSK